jgi:hypothetical protein
MKNRVFGILTVLLLIMFSGACSIPGGQKAAADYTGDLPGRAATQYPPVYDVNLSGTSVHSRYPVLAWGDTSYGAVWQNGNADTDIYFTAINRNGARTGKNVRITNTGNAMLPDLAFAEGFYDEFGVVWQDNSNGNFDIYFARIASDGTIKANNINLSNSPGSTSENPQVCWNSYSATYGVTWCDHREGHQQIYFAQVRSTSSGAYVSDICNLSTNNMNCNYPIIAWNSTDHEFAVTWEGDPDSNHNPDIYFTRIFTHGTRKIDPVQLTNSQGDSDKVSLKWNNYDHVYAMVWEDNNDFAPDGTYSNIWFALVNLDGEKIGNPFLLSEIQSYALQPSLVWNNIYREYAACWADCYNPPYRNVFQSIIDNNGANLRVERILGGAYLPNPVMAFNNNNNEYGVIGQYDNDVYFFRLDVDGNKLAQGGLTGTLKGLQAGYYYIRSVRYGTYLTDYKYPQPGALSLREFCSDASAPLTQKWQLAESTGHPGWYKIISAMDRRIVANPAENELILQKGGGGSPVLWWLHDRENDGTYLLRSKVDNSYRIYADSESSVELSTNWRSAKMFEIIPAGY